jgi:hypothetical protein
MTETLRLQLLSGVVHDNEAFEAERDSALSRQAKVANGVTFTPVRISSRNTDEQAVPDSPVCTPHNKYSFLHVNLYSSISPPPRVIFAARHLLSKNRLLSVVQMI